MNNHLPLPASSKARLQSILPAALSLVILAACSGGTGRATGTAVPPPDTTRTITGRIGYISSGPALSTLDIYGRLEPLPGIRESTFSAPAPYVQIEILGDDGRVLGQGPADNDGNYSIDLNFGQLPATKVQVRVHAAVALPFGMKIRVFPDEAAQEEYIFVTPPSGNPGVDRFDPIEVDVNIRIADGAPAFQMIRTFWDAFVLGRAGLGAGSRMPDLHIFWKEGNGAQSTFTPEIALAKLTVAGGVAGDPTSNTDVFDAAVLARLAGQYMLDYFFWEVAPDGTPNDAELVPSAAWREGFLDYYSCATRNSRIFWDTTGSGIDGRVIRYFNIESFFDPTLPPLLMGTPPGSLASNDPNVYQSASNVGMTSRFSIAEILWDIHDPDVPGTDNDGLALAHRVTLQIIDKFPPAVSYPYIYTLLDGYRTGLIMSNGTINFMLQSPEDQDMVYPADKADGTIWPQAISQNDVLWFPIFPPFSKTISDTIDTITPDPVNVEIGHETLRYFGFDLTSRSNLTVTATTTGDLEIDLLSLANRVIASGTSPLQVNDLVPARYIVRVRPADGALPQVAPYDLTIELIAP